MALLHLIGTFILLAAAVSPFSVGRHPNYRATVIGGSTRLFLSQPPPPSNDSADEAEDDNFFFASVVAKDDEGGRTLSANPFYGYGQIMRATQSPDDKRLTEKENEARRQKKIAEWESALASSSLNWGDRQAVADVPIWATPQVLSGGFASGKLLAELQVEDVPNEYYLTMPGLIELNRLLDNGCYRIRCPEHAALLVVAWLLRNDQAEDAQNILEEIGPYFHRLRFHPIQVDTPFVVANASSLFLNSVGDVKETIEQLVRNERNIDIPRIRNKIAQRKALADWLPLKWKLLSLWFETCVDGKPAEHFPYDWNQRAQLLLDEYNRLAARDQETNGHRIRHGSTKTMVSCIDICLTAGKEELQGMNKTCLESVILGSVKKYGLSHPSKFADRLGELQNSAPADKVPDLRRLITRLAEEDPEAGLSKRVADDIAARFPFYFQKYVKSCQMGSLEELIEDGLISSSEIFADLVPALAALSTNTVTADESLGRLGAALDLAFSSRQSVILFNLQSQVRLEELPWAKPIIHHRQRTGENYNAVFATLKLVAESAIKAWPQTILPNKLIQSMNALSSSISIDLDLPLTKELAADIFMGKFSRKFQKSALKAANTLQGTVYERYYDIDYRKMSDQENPLSALERRDEYGDGSFLVESRHVIEQQQIITTHNLAACYVTLALELDGRDLVLKVWNWMLDEFTQNK